MDNQLLAQITQAFSCLQTPLFLLDTAGNCLIPADDVQFELPEELPAGQTVTAQMRMFFKCAGKNDFVLMLPQADERHRDMLFLADAMISALCAANAGGGDAGTVYQRILTNEMSVAEMDAVISEYRIPAALPRCVLLMHMVQVQQSAAYDILSEMIPLSQNDVLVSMDRHTAALIKDVDGLEDADELVQFASALQETVLSETALSVTVGIGNSAPDIQGLHTGYQQARRAIEIGRVYRSEQTIFVYHSLLLERFLSDLPAATAAHYHGLLFNRKTARLFSDEMLLTIDMFFKKDLNLSDTARQLYIHRNTLVYRLDKVQRQIGLDLRHFEDAVTFKMLMDMKKCFNNKAK